MKRERKIKPKPGPGPYRRDRGDQEQGVHKLTTYRAPLAQNLEMEMGPPSKVLLSAHHGVYARFAAEMETSSRPSALTFLLTAVGLCASTLLSPFVFPWPLVSDLNLPRTLPSALLLSPLPVCIVPSATLAGWERTRTQLYTPGGGGVGCVSDAGCGSLVGWLASATCTCGRNLADTDAW